MQDQFFGSHTLQSERLSPRVVNGCRIDVADAENGSTNLRFRNPRNRTSMNEPGSSINNQQTTISILDNVCRVKIRIRGGQEVLVLGAKCRSLPKELVPLNPMGIELCAEKITQVIGT